MKWSEAQFSCEQQEAQLVTIANPLEQGRVNLWGGAGVSPQLATAEQTGATPSLFPFFWGTAAFITASLPNVTFDLWIGLHASQRDFQWIEQEPLLYTNWAPGEPSGPSPAPSGTKPVRTHTTVLFSVAVPLSPTSPFQPQLSLDGAATEVPLSSLFPQTSCAVILHSPSAHFTGRWDDRSCTEETHGFICQKGTGTRSCYTETPLHWLAALGRSRRNQTLNLFSGAIEVPPESCICLGSRWSAGGGVCVCDMLLCLGSEPLRFNVKASPAPSAC